MTTHPGNVIKKHNRIHPEIPEHRGKDKRFSRIRTHYNFHFPSSLADDIEGWVGKPGRGGGRSQQREVEDKPLD